MIADNKYITQCLIMRSVVSCVSYIFVFSLLAVFSFFIALRFVQISFHFDFEYIGEQQAANCRRRKKNCNEDRGNKGIDKTTHCSCTYVATDIIEIDRPLSENEMAFGKV